MITIVVILDYLSVLSLLLAILIGLIKIARLHVGVLKKLDDVGKYLEVHSQEIDQLRKDIAELKTSQGSK